MTVRSLGWYLSGALSILLLAAGCGGPPLLLPPGPTPPPVPPNTPPILTLLYVATNQVEAGGRVELFALVQDVETPVDELTYEWSSDKSGGQFIGAGRTVQWLAPVGHRTPETFVLTVTVSEPYQENGEAKSHRVSASVTVHYNDSLQEIGSLALSFLADFSTFAISPEECVRSFSDRCPGKFDELDDIRTNRRNYHIRSGSFSLRSITLDAAKMNATAILPCQFVSTIVIATRPGQIVGQTETVTGTCTITAVYEPREWRWYLCKSLFAGTTAAGLEPAPGMAP